MLELLQIAFLTPCLGKNSASRGHVQNQVQVFFGDNKEIISFQEVFILWKYKFWLSYEWFSGLKDILLPKPAIFGWNRRVVLDANDCFINKIITQLKLMIIWKNKKFLKANDLLLLFLEKNWASFWAWPMLAQFLPKYGPRIEEQFSTVLPFFFVRTTIW